MGEILFVTALGVFSVEIFHLVLVGRLTPKYFLPIFLPCLVKGGEKYEN